MLDSGQYIGLSIQFTEVVRSCEVALKKAAMVLDMSSGLCHLPQYLPCDSGYKNKVKIRIYFYRTLLRRLSALECSPSKECKSQPLL